MTDATASAAGSPDQPTAAVIPRFVDAARACGATAASSILEALASDVWRRWAEPARGYHDTVHLIEVLQALDALAAAGAARAQAPTTRLAAWYHDAVYLGRPGADERASAELAQQQLLSVGCTPDHVGEVVAGVLMTITHRPDSADPGQAALADADLAILAASPTRYRDYVDGVRRDYAHIDDDAFRTGRLMVITDLRGREPLFHTPAGRRLYQGAARDNLTRELHSWG